MSGQKRDGQRLQFLLVYTVYVIINMQSWIQIIDVHFYNFHTFGSRN